MPSETIYWLSVSVDERYPRIDFSHPKNRGVDWLGLAALIDGGSQASDPFGHSPVITVVPKGRKRSLAVDALWLEHRVLVSERARRTFGELKMPEVEFLALTVNEEPFYALRVSRRIDCLDRERSRIQYFQSDPTRILTIRRHVFRKEHVPDPALFELPGSRARLFATSGVKLAAEHAGLVGIEFVDIELADSAALESRSTST